MPILRLRAPRAGTFSPLLAERLFSQACWERFQMRPTPEYRFHPSRRWRFDYAFPAVSCAVEVQGGLFVQGRHSRGAALLKEHEKLNAAAALGWRILYTTPRGLLSEDFLETLRSAVQR